MAKDVETLKAERRELNRQIKAAERAAKKAERERFTAAQHDLGAWLSGSVGAASVEDVELLRLTLDSDQVQQHLRQQMGSDSSDTSVERSAVEYG